MPERTMPALVPQDASPLPHLSPYTQPCAAASSLQVEVTSCVHPKWPQDAAQPVWAVSRIKPHPDPSVAQGKNQLLFHGTGGCDSGDTPLPPLAVTHGGGIGQAAMGNFPTGFKTGSLKSEEPGLCSPAAAEPAGHGKGHSEGHSEGHKRGAHGEGHDLPSPPGLDTGLRITGEQTGQGKRITRHQSRGAMNISCPGLHTARLSPPCAPGGPPQPLSTTKGSRGQAGPPRRTPRVPSSAPPGSDTPSRTHG